MNHDNGAHGYTEGAEFNETKNIMKHFKILETKGDYPDVLIYRDRDENGTESVKVMAMGEIDGDQDMFAEEEISFANSDAAISFIRNCTVDFANDFCKRNYISYS